MERLVVHSGSKLAMEDFRTAPQLRPATQLVTTLRIEVAEGIDRGKRTTGTDVLTVGVSEGNSLVLEDPMVSRYHLEVTVQRDGIAIVDLGSTNGTFIGATRIERAVVAPGTLIKIGATSIRIIDAGRRQMALGDARELAGMRGQSPAMQRLFDDIARVAPTPASVLIVGESGTGKERVAEALHQLSPRADEPFVTVDCGALPSALLASELFGHERGAFTGAERTHAGAFERAGRGTIFLDEIGELPPTDQVTLLGVLERRRFRRVGGSQDLELHARVIAATNRDLRTEVNSARFRHDLYHRLAVVVLRTPSLRQRPEDIPALVELFARELDAEGTCAQPISEDTLAQWLHHPWPGNVRELRNAVEVALLLGPASVIEDSSGDDAGEIVPYKQARTQAVSLFEKHYVARLISRARGNVSAAARLGKMDRSYLIDLLERHKLKP
jgi:DNA-binding NtrC family response regulator